MWKQRIGAAALWALLGCGTALAGPLDDVARSADRIRATMGFLASDLLEGRGTGARGHALAGAYMAAQLAQLGVKPGGSDGTYYQPVELLGFRPKDEGKMFLRRGAAGPTRLVFGDDYVPRGSPVSAELQRSAPVVFAGFGVVAPQAGHDDYRGLDVRGKIVVVLAGAPARFGSEPRAYYGAVETKLEQVAARGAAGVLVLQTPAEERRRPFTTNLQNERWRQWDTTWREPGGAIITASARVPLLAYISLAGAKKLFADSPVPLEQLYRDAESAKRRSFALPVTLEAELHTELKSVSSFNVVGKIEGTDPALKDELVVLSSHLDHLGLKEGAEGDVIFNGAMDNASGVSTNLEVARAFAEGPPPRRSVVFLYTTAEEQSMAGSQVFARYPSVRGRLVAEVNLDMPLMTYEFSDVIAFGAERSTLGPAVRRAAERLGVKLSPDPVPEEGLFSRSDHYSFVEQGVPAVYLMTGFGDEGERSWRAFAAEHYHQVSDDLSLAINYRSGAKFARLNYEIAREIADADARPAWAPGDFFGDLFAAPPKRTGRKPQSRSHGDR